MTLTVDEYEILIKGVDAWANKDKSSGMVSSMLCIMLSKSKEEAHEGFTKTMDEANAAAQAKNETATCLKAKLILMKQAQEKENKDD